jgi:hypothetical protein
MTPKQLKARQIREAAFQRRREEQFPAFREAFELARERAQKRARNLIMYKDPIRRVSRSFNWVALVGLQRRLATLIVNHPEWIPGDCGRWLEELGVEASVIQWILEEVSKRRERAMWARIDAKRGASG